MLTNKVVGFEQLGPGNYKMGSREKKYNRLLGQY